MKKNTLSSFVRSSGFSFRLKDFFLWLRKRCLDLLLPSNSSIMHCRCYAFQASFQASASGLHVACRVVFALMLLVQPTCFSHACMCRQGWALFIRGQPSLCGQPTSLHTICEGFISLHLHLSTTPTFFSSLQTSLQLCTSSLPASKRHHPPMTNATNSHTTVNPGVHSHHTYNTISHSSILPAPFHTSTNSTPS